VSSRSSTVTSPAPRLSPCPDRRGRKERLGHLLIAVSRWALRLDGVLAERMYDSYPALLALLPDVELTANLPPVLPADTARAIESIPELSGLSPDLIATARRPSMSSPADRSASDLRKGLPSGVDAVRDARSR
jgi:hypothetical protein